MTRDRSDNDEEERLWNQFDPDADSTQPIAATETDETFDDELRPQPARSESQFDSLLEQVDEGHVGRARDRSQPNRNATVTEVESVLSSVGAFTQSGSPSQVLLESPQHHLLTNDIFRRLLLESDGEDRNVILLSANARTEQLPMIEDLANRGGGRTALIDVGQGTGNGTVTETVANGVDLYKPISNPSNLAKMGIITTHVISRWNDHPTPTVMGIHSLSTLRGYTDPETLFQFLYTLRSQLGSAGIMGLHHVDPVGTSDQELETLEAAFDVTVAVTPDGEVTVD